MSDPNPPPPPDKAPTVAEQMEQLMQAARIKYTVLDDLDRAIEKLHEHMHERAERAERAEQEGSDGREESDI